ncbi:unnamed protein product [Paramecium sonneborni]|uniref:Tr-type G domain-containing protein n=1 Tax=Paramecium sonneborni TaxID=65129 RepID=A0A8S1RTN1_9CILI|nr:unnamed protein product [Paramecium sonneborni]
MANIFYNQLVEQMENQSNIRNISVISQTGHGKQTLIDQLVHKAGIDLMDQSQQEIMINKCANLLLYYKYDKQLNGRMESFILNLIDSPKSHNCYISLTSLGIKDGVLIVFNDVKGICSQIQSTLQVIMKEKIKHVLIINKLDRAILELSQDGEAMYQSLMEAIERINDIIHIYQQEDMGDL